MKHGSHSMNVIPFIFQGKFSVKGKVDTRMRTCRAPNSQLSRLRRLNSIRCVSASTTFKLLEVAPLLYNSHKLIVSILQAESDQVEDTSILKHTQGG